MRRVLVLGDADRPLAAAIAARLSRGGLEVMGPFDLEGPVEAVDAAIEAVEAVDAAIEAAAAVDAAVRAAGAVDAAIEAWPGEPGRQRRALRLLDAALPDGAPILACCHAATATALAAGLDHPERLVGYGLLPPAEGRATVECARGLATGDGAADAAARLWAAAGLEVVWVADSPGLVTARIVACLANEATYALLERTATAADIDRAMMLGTRYPRGPLAWANLVGVGEVVATLDALAAEAGPERYRASPLLRRLAAAGRQAIEGVPGEGS